MKYKGLGMNNEIKIVFEFQLSAMLTDRFPVTYNLSGILFSLEIWIVLHAFKKLP